MKEPYRIGTYGTRGVSQAIVSHCLMSNKDGAGELSKALLKWAFLETPDLVCVVVVARDFLSRDKSACIHKTPVGINSIRKVLT